MLPDIQYHKMVHTRIAPFIHRTPVFTSSTLNEELNATVYFKGEHLQRMGAFKMRGAMNAVLALSELERAKGVCTHSSGNHGQALALAARSLAIPCYVVVPKNAPKSKTDAMLSYGAELIYCESTQSAREETVRKVAQKTGAHFVHPSNDPDVIWGQGTATLELVEEHPEIDTVLVAVGGGGLLAGTCLAAKALHPNIEIYAAEPALAADAKESLDSGKIVPAKSSNTIADGLRTGLGDLNFPIIKEYTKDILTVDEHEIAQATRWTWERMKQVIEPSAGVPLAALRRYPEKFTGRTVGVILCGGNVDLNNLSF